MVLKFIEQLLILLSTVTVCVSISAFEVDSLRENHREFIKTIYLYYNYRKQLKIRNLTYALQK